MKPIIALTDFSFENEAANLFAGWLSNHLGAQLVLLHVYSLPVIMNDMLIPIVPYEELQKNAENNIQKIKSDLERNHAGIQISTEVKIGDLVDEVKTLSKSIDPFMIVLGNRGPKDDSIFGSTLMSVIRHTTTPVLAIPEGYSNFKISKTVLASDLSETTQSVHKILDVVKGLNSELHVVHVFSKNSETINENVILEQLQEVKPVFHAVQDTDIAHGLQRYINEINADLLLLLPHEHNLVERFFFKLHTSELVHKSNIPVLSIHE